jgi:hypothetical protein
MMQTVLLMMRGFGRGGPVLDWLIWAGLVFACVISVGPVMVGPVMANSQKSMAQSCDLAAVRASEITGVPRSILLAIARVESGRTVSGTYGPWPWTINQGGRGIWFSTGADAITHVNRALHAGETNIDIGCFQLSYRWHGAAFADIASMFDPEKNAIYAATYLQKHFARTGTWAGAIGAYHSRREEAATDYLTRVKSHIADPLSDIGLNNRAATKQPAPKDNRFPLLRNGPGRMPGSLVSTQGASSVTFFLR